MAEAIEETRKEANVLERCGRTRDANQRRLLADRFEDALRRRRHKWVPTTEAAQISGYSHKRLRQMGREEQVEARKEGGEWLFRRSSLPRKATAPDQGESPLARHLNKAGG